MFQLDPLSITHSSTVTADQIDELGHMNVRFYGQNAIAASKAVTDRLGFGEPALLSTYTRHHNEQMEGSELHVRSAVLPGGDRLRLFHELRNTATDALAATFVHELDVDGSRSDGAAAPDFALPDYGRPRSLSLDTDARSAAPSIDELRDRDLAIRFERKVDAEDSADAEVVPSWLASNLIWGGERTDGKGDGDWITDGPNGERMAFATMESRLWIGELPALGTRIQSFGCIVAISEKISHGLNWAYDIETDQPLVIFEVINLAFDITGRRSMVIPKAMRAQEQQCLHTDLAL